jgi:eukaryotic-like serine/threonine-protein kinase
MDLAAQQIPPGEQIGPYQVVRRLGAGGMGEVYLARHRHLNRDAAVKVLLAEISMNQTVVSRFFTEARATAQLRHPNIVEIFDCDVLPDGRAYIVMEYLRGESLRGTLGRLGKLCPDYSSIAAITGMVADALQAAHGNGIVHRDLKPDNTFLSVFPNQRDELTVKVLDFGIAKLLSGNDPTGGGGTPTRTGSLIGTPLYMSPEQCRGIPTVDHRADIYSLGCMVFEMVVGQPPFVSEAPGDILMAHMIRNAPQLSSFQPDVPAEMDALVALMLAKDPDTRPQSMSAVVIAVESLLGIRKAEFAQALRRPVGFPETPAQATTQILPPEGSPPIRQTPHSSRREFPSNRGVDAPIGTPIPSSQPKSTPPAHVQTPIRQRSTPASSQGRHKAPVLESPLLGASDDPPTAEKPKWAIPVVVIALVVGLGGSTAYLLTRPPPTPPMAGKAEPAKEAEPPIQAESVQKNSEFAPPSEVNIEIITSPVSASIWLAGESSSRGTTPTRLTLPRSTLQTDIILKAPGYLDKRLALDTSRDRTVDVNLEPRESTRPQVKASESKKSADISGAKKGRKGGGFNPVGD